METLELPLYNTKESPQLLISKHKEIRPPSSSINPQKSIEGLLSSMFPLPGEENKVISTRKLLGETGKAFSEDQIDAIVASFQYLIDSWLDAYEKQVFGGKILREILLGKNYGNYK